MTGTYGTKHERLTPCATRIIIFQRENLNYLIVCITQGTFFFSTRLFAVCYLENVCNETSRLVTTDRMSIKKPHACKTKSFFKAVALCSDC